jgi:uncharacterized protein YcfL
MKKLLVLLATASILLACEKEPEIEKTTVQIENNTSFDESSIKELDGTLYEVELLTFIGDDMSGQISLTPINSGTISNKIEIDAKVEKVKLSFTLLPYDHEYADVLDIERNYTASFTFITKEENNIITLNSNTLISSKLKSGEHILLKSITK